MSCEASGTNLLEQGSRITQQINNSKHEQQLSSSLIQTVPAANNTIV